MRFTLFIVLLLHVICCSLEKKLYNLVLDRMEVYFQNTTIWTTEAKVDYFNRTTKAIYINFTLYKPLPRKSVAYIRSYLLSGNEYRLSIVQIKGSTHDLMTYQFYDIKRMFQELTSPPITGWPFTPMIDYRLGNFFPDVDKFPRFLPEKPFKVAISIYWDDAMSLEFVRYDLYGDLQHAFDSNNKG